MELQNKSESKGKLRCPACFLMVTLPAETCPHCGLDFKTGLPTVVEEPPASKWRLVAAVLGLLIIIGVGGLILSGYFTRPQVAAPPLATQPKGGPEEALDALQGLAEQPHSLQPGPILDQTRSVLEQAEQKKQEERQDFLDGDFR